MEEKTILRGLNGPQQQAVQATEGRIRVIAGAGSGKTRVLVQRYIWLLEILGINPSGILCMTFTNKAAQEMRRRVEAATGARSVNDLICTIHSFCLKVLRRDIYRLGFPKTFTILDETDQKAIVRDVFEDFHVSRRENTLDRFVKEMTGWKAEHKITYIPQYMLPASGRENKGQYTTENLEQSASDARNGLSDAEDEPDDPSTDRKIVAYLKRQVQLAALDFNDIIHFAIYLFRTFKEVRLYWQKQLNYVMMDEAQDCNENDWFLMETLTGLSGNLFVVGDPDQAIYEWRGAVPELFNRFKPDHDILLTENYRSTPQILNVANSIICHNRMRIEKALFTKCPKGDKPLHYHAPDEKSEADWIATQIKKELAQHNGTLKASAFAVLYRASYLSRAVEQALVKKGIPYTIWGGVRFFDRREIKDAIAYLSVVERGDDLSFLRVINVPSRKAGKAFLNYLKGLAEAEGSTLYNTLVKHRKEKLLARPAVQRFIDLIEECRTRKADMRLSALMDMLLSRSGLQDLVRRDGDEDRLENLAELQNAVKVYEEENRNETVTPASFLQDIALYSERDTDVKPNAVRLMTIHQSKGLEFPCVFICGLSEGIFPSARTIRDRKEKGEEEERRLMYVAVTRAERQLFLTESEGYDSSSRSDRYPSRFLLEVEPGQLKLEGKMDPALLEGTRRIVSGGMVAASGDASSEEKSSFYKGQSVRHRVFGSGIVQKVNSDNSCVVKFYGGERCIQERFLTPEDDAASSGKRTPRQNNSSKNKRC